MEINNITVYHEENLKEVLQRATRKFEREIIDVVDPRLRRALYLANTGCQRVAKKNNIRIGSAIRTAGYELETVEEHNEVCLNLIRSCDRVPIIGLVTAFEKYSGETRTEIYVRGVCSIVHYREVKEDG